MISRSELRETGRLRSASASSRDGAAALVTSTIAVPPRSTDDYFRYAWDGRVQAAGIDPYSYPPTDPALSRLRDDWLFPPGCRAPEPACTRKESA